MSAATVGTYGLWTFYAASAVVFLSIVIKTKWFRSKAGRNVFALSLWFFLTLTLIVFANLGLLDSTQFEIGRIVVYWTGASILFWRAWTIWRWTQHFWAWSKGESDGS